LIDHYRAMIESALEYSGGTHTFEDVKAMIIAGTAQIWPAPRGVVVTEIIEYPRKRVLHIFLAAGELDQFFDMAESAEAWGRAQGCVSMTLSGRMGWQRVMHKHGWKPVLVTMEKPI
jgi:hypothetical protein